MPYIPGDSASINSHLACTGKSGDLTYSIAKGIKTQHRAGEAVAVFCVIVLISRTKKWVRFNLPSLGN
jgi:hypothetical protein